MGTRGWASLAAGLTLIDATATAAWIHHDLAREGNPLYAPLTEGFGVVAAMTLRATVGITLVGALYLLDSRSAWARPGLQGITVVLAGVAIYHVIGGTR